MIFSKACEKCGRSIAIDEEICEKCGFNFIQSSRKIPKCPYCEKELHITDFYTFEVDKKGRRKNAIFLGELREPYTKMWNCPYCGKILGFTDSDRS